MEILYPGPYISKKCDLEKSFSSSLSSQYVPKTCWVRLEDVLKTWQQQFNLVIRLENVLKLSWRHLSKGSWCLQDVLKTSWQNVLKEDAFKMYHQDEYIRLDQGVLKISSEEVWLKSIYSSLSRRLEDVFWRWRRKTSSRRLQDIFIKANVCWDFKIFIAEINIKKS